MYSKPSLPHYALEKARARVIDVYRKGVNGWNLYKIETNEWDHRPHLAQYKTAKNNVKIPPCNDILPLDGIRLPIHLCLARNSMKCAQSVARRRRTARRRMRRARAAPCVSGKVFASRNWQSRFGATGNIHRLHYIIHYMRYLIGKSSPTLDCTLWKSYISPAKFKKNFLNGTSNYYFKKLY